MSRWPSRWSFLPLYRCAMAGRAGITVGTRRWLLEGIDETTAGTGTTPAQDGVAAARTAIATGAPTGAGASAVAGPGPGGADSEMRAAAGDGPGAASNADAGSRPFLNDHAQRFVGLSGSFSDRFTKGVVESFDSSAGGVTGGRTSTAPSPAEGGSVGAGAAVSVLPGERETKAASDSQKEAPRAAKPARQTILWRPEALLCKRLNVPVPQITRETPAGVGTAATAGDVELERLLHHDGATAHDATGKTASHQVSFHEHHGMGVVSPPPPG